jgi:hypothetical protein
MEIRLLVLYKHFSFLKETNYFMCILRKWTITLSHDRSRCKYKMVIFSLLPTVLIVGNNEIPLNVTFKSLICFFMKISSKGIEPGI